MSKRKLKQKQKQRQKQSQNITINVSQPKDKSKSSQPITPSFTFNQPQPIAQSSNDLAKILGLLIPKLQTESKIGLSIPAPVHSSVKTDIVESPKIAELVSNKKESLIGNALDYKIAEAKPYEEPVKMKWDEDIEDLPVLSPIQQSVLKVPPPQKPKSRDQPIQREGDIRAFMKPKEDLPPFGFGTKEPEPEFGIGPVMEVEPATIQTSKRKYKPRVPKKYVEQK